MRIQLVRRFKRRTTQVPVIALLILCLASMACNLSVVGEAGGAIRPPVMFLAPDTNSMLAQGATIQLAVSAHDPGGAGVARVDFTLDGAPLGSQSAPKAAGQPDFVALQVWTATNPQGHLISAAAYRADNSPIGEAALIITVVTLPGTPTATPTLAASQAALVEVTVPFPSDVPSLTPSITTAAIFTSIPLNTAASALDTSSGTPPTATLDPAAVQATVTNAYLNVRGGPGINYGVIGSFKAGDVLTIIGRNADKTWWVVQGAQIRGWIINTPSYLRISGDTSKIPLAAAPPSPVPSAISPTALSPLVATSTPH